MPNFPLSQGIRDHLVKRVRRVSERAVAAALMDFPLSVEQIQHAILPHDQLNRMRQLHDEGIQTIEQHETLRLAFLKRENLPGLKRSAVFTLTLPTWIFVGRGTRWGISTTKFEVGESHYLVPTLEDVSTELRQELAEYIERVIRQVRLQEIVHYCAREILIGGHGTTAPTVSHLHALWPTVCTLIEPRGVSYQREREMLEKWVERMRNPARRALASYQPEPAVRNKFDRLVTAADTQLLAGLMLNDPQSNPKRIAATLEHWERLENDLHLKY